MNIHKNTFLVFVLFSMSKTFLFAQQTICIPYGAPSVIDGIISTGEWSDADSVQIAISASQVVTVKLKHDSLNLYLSYCKNLESAFRFPEVVMDINNDKSNTWMADDWWFHVSATDCEWNGAPSNFSNCLAVQPGWEAVPNMLSVPPYKDTIEIKIPFLKVGINLLMHDTIGLAFDVTNTSTIWNYWPSGSNINNPSTWANAVFCHATTGLNELNFKNHIKIFPNPSGGKFTIQSLKKCEKIEIFNVFGFLVYSSQINSDRFDIDLSNESKGIYFCNLFSSEKNFLSEKIIIE